MIDANFIVLFRHVHRYRFIVINLITCNISAISILITAAIKKLRFPPLDFFTTQANQSAKEKSKSKSNNGRGKY